MYSSLDDALASRNQWSWCNYDMSNVGFPRDCGQSALTRGSNQWITEKQDGQPGFGSREHYKFEIIAIEGNDGKVASVDDINFQEYMQKSFTEDKEVDIGFTRPQKDSLDEYYEAKYIQHDTSEYNFVGSYSLLQYQRKFSRELLMYMQDYTLTRHAFWNYASKFRG